LQVFCHNEKIIFVVINDQYFNCRIEFLHDNLFSLPEIIKGHALNKIG
jgi:hypothetical protein